MHNLWLYVAVAAFPSRGRWRGDELHPAAVCQSHRWGERGNGHARAPPQSMETLRSASAVTLHSFSWSMHWFGFFFYTNFLLALCLSPSLSRSSWVPAMLSCPPSLLMPWCSQSHSLRRETWRVGKLTQHTQMQLTHNPSLSHICLHGPCLSLQLEVSSAGIL